MKRSFARGAFLLAAAALIGACGAAPVTKSTPSPSPAVSAPAPESPPAPTPVAAGAPAWVAVSVASGWRSPSSPRAVDGPALQNPVDVAGWLGRMTDADKVALIDRLDTQALLGDKVLVAEVSRSWAKVTIPGQPSPLDGRGYPVWMPVRQLNASPPPASSRLVRVVAPHAYLRSARNTVEVSFGTTLPLLGAIGAVDLVGVPGGSTMTINALSVTQDPLPATGASVVATARQFLGLPYLWGGTSGYGFDCSGLIHLVYRAHGIVLPRDSDPQSKFGVSVARSSLQPGDLVFFSNAGVAYHVAIYAGAGMVIDSPSPGYAVRTIALTSMPNIGDYSGARRVLR